MHMNERVSNVDLHRHCLDMTSLINKLASRPSNYHKTSRIYIPQILCTTSFKDDVMFDIRMVAHYVN